MDHYDTDTGEWDGQLPNAGLVSDPPDTPSRDRSSGGLLDRMQWAMDACLLFNLSAPERAVLNNLAFHMDRHRAQWAMSQATIGLEIAVHPRMVHRAMKGLIQRGLVVLLRSGKGNIDQATNVYSLSGFGMKWSFSPRRQDSLSQSETQSPESRLSVAKPDTESEFETQSDNYPSVYPSLNPPLDPSGYREADDPSDYQDLFGPEAEAPEALPKVEALPKAYLADGTSPIWCGPCAWASERL